MTDDQLTATAHAMMMSPTMQLIANLANDMPIDPTSKESVNAAIAVTTWELAKAMDDKRIHFDKTKDRAMFHGLMTVAMQVMFDGRMTDYTMPAPPLQ